MPEHNVQALTMRVTPQANITDGTGTTIPVPSAAKALQVLARTARLQGGPIIVRQQGYDPADPTAGTTMSIDTDGNVTEKPDPSPGRCWEVTYHSWVITAEHEGTYTVPGVPTAFGDARMLATDHGTPVAVYIEDIKPDTSTNTHTLIEPAPEQTPDDAEATTHSGPEEHHTGKDPDMSDHIDELHEPDGPVTNEEPATDQAGHPSMPEDHAAAEDEDTAQAPTLPPSTQQETDTADTHGNIIWPDLPDPDLPEPDLPGLHPIEPDPVDRGITDPAPVASEPLEPATGGSDISTGSAVPGAGAKRRRRVVVSVVVALAVLAGGAAAAATTVLGPASPESTSSTATVGSALWQTSTVPGDTALSSHGVLINTIPGKAEVFSTTDGTSLGGGPLPEGPVRVISGTSAAFAVVTGADGTNTGYAANAAGVKDFKNIKGTLVTRGTEPFLLTGTGKNQAALVWDKDGWKPVKAPEPGMAPVAASKNGVLWLGANGRLVTGTTASSLHTPDGAVKISSWVAADETTVTLLWDTPTGKVLAVHSLTDGTITGHIPAPDGEARKDGDLIRAGTQAYTIESGAPVAADCADPVTAGGRQWCKTGNTWAAKNTRPLAPGQTPVPSPKEMVITATNEGFTAYPGDTNNN